jgi:hypothetical protein
MKKEAARQLRQIEGFFDCLFTSAPLSEKTFLSVQEDPSMADIAEKSFFQFKEAVKMHPKTRYQILRDFYLDVMEFVYFKEHKTNSFIAFFLEGYALTNIRLNAELALEISRVVARKENIL